MRVMLRFSPFRVLGVAGAAALAAFVAPWCAAAEPNKALDSEQAEVRTVELFAGIKSGDIEVQLIPKSAKSANVLIRNKSDKPLRIALPEAFAGVPVLAQALGAGGGIGGGGFGGGGMGGGGGGQGFGGGFGGGGMGGGMGGGGFGGGGGMGGGLFNIAADKVGKISVTTVCLEHGKLDPTPRMKYEIRPIESFTQKPEVIELCKLLGKQKINQLVAQAATWHFTDNLSWDELAAKVGKEHLNGTQEPFFLPEHIAAAMQLASFAERLAQDRISDGDGKSDSLSGK